MSLCSPEDIQAWFEAVQLYDAGKIQESVEKFYEVSLQNSRILFNLGCCFLSMNESDLAAEKYALSVENDQHLAVGYFMRGLTSYIHEEFEDAVLHFEQAKVLLRGNKYLDYKQLGLNFQLYECEILANQAVMAYHIGDYDLANDYLIQAVDCATEKKHDTIAEMLYLINSGNPIIPFNPSQSQIFRPPKSYVNNLKKKNYLGKSKVLSTENTDEIYACFSGIKQDIINNNNKPKPAIAKPLHAKTNKEAAAYLLEVESSPLPTRKNIESSEVRDLDITTSPITSPRSSPPPIAKLPPTPTIEDVDSFPPSFSPENVNKNTINENKERKPSEDKLLQITNDKIKNIEIRKNPPKSPLPSRPRRTTSNESDSNYPISDSDLDSTDSENEELNNEVIYTNQKRIESPDIKRKPPSSPLPSPKSARNLKSNNKSPKVQQSPKLINSNFYISSAGKKDRKSSSPSPIRRIEEIKNRRSSSPLLLASDGQDEVDAQMKEIAEQRKISQFNFKKPNDVNQKSKSLDSVTSFDLHSSPSDYSDETDVFQPYATTEQVKNSKNKDDKSSVEIEVQFSYIKKIKIPAGCSMDDIQEIIKSISVPKEIDLCFTDDIGRQQKLSNKNVKEVIRPKSKIPKLYCFPSN